MGMFDWVRSSYPLPEPFMGTNQTKDIEDYYSGTMTHFWIDPEGYLWYGDYRNTHDFHTIDEHDMLYNSDHPWANFEWVPTGEHGKWRVHPITKYIEIYPEQWEGKWEDWPRLKIHFRSGKLQDFVVTTGR